MIIDARRQRVLPPTNADDGGTNEVYIVSRDADLPHLRERFLARRDESLAPETLDRDLATEDPIAMIKALDKHFGDFLLIYTDSLYLDPTDTLPLNAPFKPKETARAPVTREQIRRYGGGDEIFA